METTFNNLPDQVDKISQKLESIEKLLLKKEAQTEDQNRLLTIDEASEYLNLAKPTVYSKVSQGTIPYMKKSKRLYFSKEELLEYVREGRKKTNSEIESDAVRGLLKNKVD